MSRTIALCFEYDGTAFCGSQWQTDGRSVQGDLEAAWRRLTGETLRWTFAGRTDAGVHALAQVAHCQSETRHSLDTLVRALNALTAADLTIHEAWELPGDFHARFSARQRSYRYLLDLSPSPSALLHERVLAVGQPLDIAAMAQALELLVGEHDFAAFTGAGQVGGTLRTCSAASIAAGEMLGRPLVTVNLSANAFLKHMIRNIVGTLLMVGQGRMDLDGWAAVFASRDRRKAGPTAPPHGLYLETISYDPAFAPLEASARWDGKTAWRTYGKSSQPAR
ncbi:MAG TPA: tRNA pseudouridine(38-40) synthase TruA [Herpetosiphonaceae bacterium]|nr:tRNA pseudouridine(38-40) synthase TruA [Herpetosiphonaceae bacterium]